MKKRILNTEIGDRQLAMFYTGQEGFVLKFRGIYVLVDGYLTGGLYGPENPGGRNYLSPIKPEELDFIDYVFCSHDHLDHADPDTLSGIVSVNSKARFIIPAAFAARVAEYGVPSDRIIPAHEGQLLSFPEFSALPIASAHEELHQDEQGDYREMGFRFNFDGITVYHSGDCCVYDGLKEKIGNVSVAMLPVNGRSYYKLKHWLIGNMTLEEAVLLASEVHAQLFVPLHFDLFPGNSIPASYIPAAVEQYAKGMPYHIFTPGERLIFANN